MQAGVALLKSMDNAEKALALTEEIDHLESDADKVSRDSISRLFREEMDVRQLIKRENVYEYLEEAIDAQDVADVIRIGGHRGKRLMAAELAVPLATLVLLVAVALVFDFINGLHDAANSIATVVSTRVLTPALRGRLGRVLQLHRGLHVRPRSRPRRSARASSIPHRHRPQRDLGALIGAIVWNLITWYFGIPSASSHALIGGLSGAALAKAGVDAARHGRASCKTLAFIVLSPAARHAPRRR